MHTTNRVRIIYISYSKYLYCEHRAIMRHAYILRTSIAPIFQETTMFWTRNRCQTGLNELLRSRLRQLQDPRALTRVAALRHALHKMPHLF